MLQINEPDLFKCWYKKGRGSEDCCRLRDIYRHTKCKALYLIGSWFKKKSYKRYYGELGKFPMNWVYERILGNLLILLGVIMVLWLNRKLSFYGEATVFCFTQWPQTWLKQYKSVILQWTSEAEMALTGLNSGHRQGFHIPCGVFRGESILSFSI